MNFIDKAFANNLQGDDFLQAMADIFSESEVWELLDKYPRFVKDVIFIIDYDYEIQLEGLDNVIDGLFGEKLSEILGALDNCGATNEANVLREAKEMFLKNYEEYEENYETFCNKLAINNDYDGFWDLVRNYIDTSLNA